jgi:peptidyl-prolyl cis-trans isomerase C
MSARHTAGVLGAILMLAALGGCNTGDSGTASDFKVHIPGQQDLPYNPKDVIATVNGQPITGGMFQMYVDSRKAQQPGVERLPREELLKEFINLQLLAQSAAAAGLQKEAKVADELRYHSDSVLAAAQLEQTLKGIKVGEPEMRAEYARRYEGGPQREYQTRNILVADRKTADELIGQLQKGADFATLAKAKSIGPAAASGGALDWFRPQDVLKEFAHAVEKLKKGEYTDPPVHTKYGWNVVLLEDVREVQPPPYEKVAAQIHAELLNKHVTDYLAKLRAGAKIDIKKP